MQECLYFILLSPRLLSFNFHVRYHTYTQYTVLSHSSLTVNPLYLHSSILSRYSLTVNPLSPHSYFLSRYSLTVNPLYVSPFLYSISLFSNRQSTISTFLFLSRYSLTVNPLYLHWSILSRYSLTVNPLSPHSYFLSRYSLTVNPLSPHFLSHYSLSHLFYLAPLYTLLLQFTHCLCLSLSFSPFASQFLSLYSSMLPNLAFL